MIPRECKRLIEVDFPIAEVSKHSAKEKSIRHGHPSTLHLWWARRPLAACRAVLMGLLLPDPADPNCPEEFRREARRVLVKLPEMKAEPEDEGLRQMLLKFIGQFAAWELSSEPTYLEASRALVKAAHPEETPLVVDPFAGGGSIPLEALRLGCDAFASDLNPVACLILKVLLEDIPRHGPKLAEELRRVGAQIKAEAEKELAQFYPPDPDGSRPIAYLWARTVRCESPNCGAEIPLARSFWLSKKANRKRALKCEIHHRDTESTEKGKGEGKIKSKTPCSPCLRGKDTPFVSFEIFEPKSDGDVPGGTVSRANATCPCCGVVLPAERVRAQLSAQRGGADVVFAADRPKPTRTDPNRDGDGAAQRVGGALLLAVVTLKPGRTGRHYRLPTDRDYAAVHAAQQAVAKLPPGAVPDEPVDQWHHDVNRLPMYGMQAWGEAFTARQKVALLALSRHLITAMGSDDRHLAGLVVGRLADFCVSLARWKADAECPVQALSRQALPMVWDFAEVNPCTDSTGSVVSQTGRMAEAVESVCLPFRSPGQVELADAAESPLPNETALVWFTDPPYYDAIDYAHCSDFFFVWLKRTLAGVKGACDPFDAANPLTPKAQEIVVDSTTTRGHGNRTPEFYETRMAAASGEGRRVLRAEGVATVVFAHKTTEGWEALLSGMLQAGWTITGSWPIATEAANRLRAFDSAALAASIHLVCRPRPEDADTGGWEDILQELPVRVQSWVERLSGEGIRGADLVFSCIGPALELFSRHPRVETAEGEEVGLAPNPKAATEAGRRGFLSYVWEAVGKAALAQVLKAADADAAAMALEEDARLTALFLWTLQATNGDGSGNGGSKSARYALPFDIARRFAQPLGIELDDWKGRVIAIDKGVVSLLPLRERAKVLFGDRKAADIADDIERASRRSDQLSFEEFLTVEPLQTPAPRRGKRRRPRLGTDDLTAADATTLDRVHAAMLFQSRGQTAGLRALLETEQNRGPDFLRLANALSALYPQGSEEKRLVDAMLLAVPR